MLLGLPLNNHSHFHVLEEGSRRYTSNLTEFSEYLPGQSVKLFQLRSNFYSLILWDGVKMIYKRRIGESEQPMMYQLIDLECNLLFGLMCED